VLDSIPLGETLPLTKTRLFLSRYFYGPFPPLACHIDYPPVKDHRTISLINPCPGIKSIDLDLSIYTPNEIAIYRIIIGTKIGTTLSYGSLARLAGISRGARFVGTTMAKNIFPILIPCHRVIRSDGTIGRYSGGEGVKEYLLKHENDIVRQGGVLS
jgi:O-6-methylguanine DNA methyltransferase